MFTMYLSEAQAARLCPTGGPNGDGMIEKPALDGPQSIQVSEQRMADGTLRFRADNGVKDSAHEIEVLANFLRDSDFPQDEIDTLVDKGVEGRVTEFHYILTLSSGHMQSTFINTLTVKEGFAATEGILFEIAYTTSLEKYRATWPQHAHLGDPITLFYRCERNLIS